MEKETTNLQTVLSLVHVRKSYGLFLLQEDSDEIQCSNKYDISDRKYDAAVHLDQKAECTLCSWKATLTNYYHTSGVCSTSLFPSLAMECKLRKLLVRLKLCRISVIRSSTERFSASLAALFSHCHSKSFPITLLQRAAKCDCRNAEKNQQFSYHRCTYIECLL